MYLTYRGSKIRITANVSETMQAREGSKIFKVLRKQNHQPRTLNPVKLSFKSEGAIKTFSVTKIEGNCFW